MTKKLDPTIKTNFANLKLLASFIKVTCSLDGGLDRFDIDYSTKPDGSQTKEVIEVALSNLGIAFEHKGTVVSFNTTTEQTRLFAENINFRGSADLIRSK